MWILCGEGEGGGEVVVVIVGGWVGRVSAADTYCTATSMAASDILIMQLGLRPNVTANRLLLF